MKIKRSVIALVLLVMAMNLCSYAQTVDKSEDVSVNAIGSENVTVYLSREGYHASGYVVKGNYLNVAKVSFPFSLASGVYFNAYSLQEDSTGHRSAITSFSGPYTKTMQYPDPFTSTEYYGNNFQLYICNGATSQSEGTFLKLNFTP